MDTLGSDCESLLKVIQAKQDLSFKYFMGNGPLASSMYIDSSLLRVKDQKTQTFDDLYKEFLSNDSISRSNLIIGDSGLGKTTLGIQICQKFWKDHDLTQIDTVNDRIPIYIHLPSVIKTFKKNILIKFFSKDQSLVDSVAKLKLLLILDGFDELSDRNVNISKVNKWGYPPYRDVRVVILSRQEIPQSHKTGLFEFTQEGAPPPSNSESSYSEYLIQPFNSEQIHEYIDRFDQFIQSKCVNELSGSVWEMTKAEYIKLNWSKTDYLKWFTRFRDLRSLAQTPLILTLITQTLPKVCRGHQGSSETQTDIFKNIEKFCKTKVSVFDGFTESWFDFQFKRLVKANRLTDFRINWLVFKEFCYAFGQNVAYSMISGERDESRGLLQDSFVSKELIDKKFLEVNGNDYSVSQKVQSECIEILKSSGNIPELLEAVRIACLIKYAEIDLSRNEKTFLITFFHRSVAEYFVSRDLFQGLAGEFDFFLGGAENENLCEEENVRGLNSYLLKEEGILLNLSDQLKHESDLKNILFKIIYKSREVSLISIMSANAITILNIGGISLSGRDFSWVQIPGANLNHSICGNTNFNGANLQNVSFENSWLFRAQFKGANLEGTRFGLVPTIPVENVFHIEVRQEHFAWYLYAGTICMTTWCLKISKWDLSTLKKVKEYETTCSEGTTKIRFSFNFWNEKYLCVWRENLILFDLEIGEELAQVGIPSDATLEDMESESPAQRQILGVAPQGFFIAWGKVLRIFDINLILEGTKNIQLTLRREYTIDFPTFPPIVMNVLNSVSKFQTPEIIDFRNDDEFGIVVGYITTIRFIDKDYCMTFDNLLIKAFDIDSKKRQIVIAGHLGFIEVWGIDTKVRLKKIRHSSEFIQSLIYSPDFKYLISIAIDHYYGNSVKIWDTENDWSIFNIIQLGKEEDLPISIRTWSTSNGQTTLAIQLSQSIQFHSINQDETNNQTRNKMITRTKFTAQHSEFISCSIDGNFVATMSRVDQAEEQGRIIRQLSQLTFYAMLGHGLLGSNALLQVADSPEMKKIILKDMFRECHPVELYTIQIYNALTGSKGFEFEFPLEIGSEILHMTFIVNNRIMCILKTEQGKTFSLIYDLEGNILKNRTDMNISNCGFYSTQLNRDGSLIAIVMRNGQIQLFKLMSDDPYVQERGCIQNSTIDSNLIPRVVSFNSSGTCLASASLNHAPHVNAIFKNAQIQIWNIRNESLTFITEFRQCPFRLPVTIVTPGGLISFDLTTLSSHQFDLSLIAQVNNQNNNIVKISQMEGQELKDVFEITFWFKIRILRFIQQSESSNRSRSRSRLLVSDQINTSCLEICLNQYSKPTWSILWSFCSDLNLVVKELSLNGCISLNPSIFHSLRRLGALSDKNIQMASASQEYISKSNLICPILGSSDLAHSSILSCENNECLSPSDDNWILSVIGKKTTIPLLERVAEVKVVSHVFLALEGLRRSRRFITEAHLYESDSKTYFVLRPIRDFKRFRIENEGPSIKQWYRTREQGERLLDDILLDYQNHWEYKFLSHNCVAWTKKKLKNIGIRFKSSVWDRLIVSPNAVLNRERVM